MALTGQDPFDPIPSDKREIIFAVGENPTGGTSRDVLLFGNKTSSGSEATNAIGGPILSDDDAKARMGIRSELYNMWKKYVAVDKGVTAYFVAIPEGGGATAASAGFTFATTATGVSQVEISFIGEKVYASVNINDTPTVVAAAVSAAINAASEGTWPVTSSPSAGVVTVSAANVGTRGDLLIGSSAAIGMRMRILNSVAMTVTKGALTPGATADDNTAALAEAAKSVYYYQVSPYHAITTVTAVDNSIGEHIDMIRQQFLPANGKGQEAFFGLVGTQAQATAVAISAAANATFAHFVRQKNSDWSPGMLAAHLAAIARSQQIAHPAANFNGYASTDNTVFQVPAYFTKADIPSEVELRADLNNGVCTIGQTPRGAPYLVRYITSRSLNAQGNSDYRAREGHIPSVMNFTWETILARWQSQKQPFCDNDPPAGQKPALRTSTPSQLNAIIASVMTDFVGDKPLGTYNGPILSRSKLTKMKDSIVVTKPGAGYLSAMAQFYAVEHQIKSETTLAESSPAY